MPGALSIAVRQLIADQHSQGKKLIEISAWHDLSYATVRNIYKRYKQQGAAGLVPRYHL